MKNIPTLFSFPAWYGKIKRRTAKKLLNQRIIGTLIKKQKFSNYQIGDIVNDCSGFNANIIAIDPVYQSVAGGYILVDIDLQTSMTGCSLTHCGIEPQLSQEKIESAHFSFIQKWVFGEAGKKWYGGLDNSEYESRIQILKNRFATIKNGGHITDDDGFLLKEFSF